MLKKKSVSNKITLKNIKYSPNIRGYILFQFILTLADYDLHYYSATTGSKQYKSLR